MNRTLTSGFDPAKTYSLKGWYASNPQAQKTKIRERELPYNGLDSEVEPWKRGGAQIPDRGTSNPNRVRSRFVTVVSLGNEQCNNLVNPLSNDAIQCCEGR